jgi:aliphatic aldoxime dehydratase
MIPVYDRIHPLRKPKGFEPVVQRWSVGFPNKCQAMCVSFYGVQGSARDTVYRSQFFAWLQHVQDLSPAPTVVDHASFKDRSGLYTHIAALYWIDPDQRDRWAANPHVADWWNSSERLDEGVGYFKECLTIPLERQETIYWQDYPGGLSRSPEVAVYPTPYCGYYGAMRDRLPLAAIDPLLPEIPDLPPRSQLSSRGSRWRVSTPNNLTVIRSAAFWGRCDPGQTEDYMRDLRAPLEHGMAYLRDNPGDTGCCSLRFQQSCDAGGAPFLETHALGYFLSLDRLEKWAERHSSHEAIFSAAIARYRKYGAANQLRTWHEVFVLPRDGQLIEYVNCAPETGLLGYFDAVEL